MHRHNLQCIQNQVNLYYKEKENENKRKTSKTDYKRRD